MGLKRRTLALLFVLTLSILCSCARTTAGSEPLTASPEPTNDVSGQAEAALTADVISVEVSGSPGAYIFSVGISSPDTGCSQYADWWEVLTEDGELVYRRILTHSHVAEQPFVRTGGPVSIDAGTLVVVRAHFHLADSNHSGYGGKGMRGSAAAGFTEVDLEPGFALDLEPQGPQPAGCDF